ncbi:WcbI family polysaccharide biosynthesis putative acetyltransferase [Acuticoccus kandeliae]|uniref:WcbI family polysaccharide biosynthesis putative acetyltransferase n=1 Tax=Acuticoccus kandeliae TaxID=2073160 RepID=UPI0013007146|nr:WcbI family polysaccharide biosynthesis putative acetyltransferase [Acuticoccus kandeliae]
MKIATIQNCQSQPTADYLQRAIADVDITQFRLDHPGWDDPVAQERFLDEAKNADFVFSQPNSRPLLTPAALNQRFGQKLVLVTNLHYRGLTPDCCYVGARASRLSGPLPYHSIVVLEAFRRGLSATECVSKFSPDGFEELGLFGVHDQALTELGHREADAPVKGVELINRFYRSHRLFYTMNHPTIFMMSRYMSQILKHIDVRQRRVDVAATPDRLAEHQVLPIFDFVADYFKLKYRTTQLYQNNYKFISINNIVDGFYRLYSKLPSDQLKSAVQSLRTSNSSSNIPRP